MMALDHIDTFHFDVVIVGAGGAGLRAALQLSQSSQRVAVVSKVFPTRSHTVAAQGGINAALGNVTEDNWHWHMYDTIKGSDYLGDQDAIEFMCREASEIVRELEHFGVPFSRTDQGKIYQRPFGGQSRNFGESQATRTCAAADRTGHAILQTLYQQNIQAGTTFFNEYFAIDLVKDDRQRIAGMVVMNMQTGEYQLIRAHAVMMATGGACQLFKTNTNAKINTGDGLAMVARAGLPLQDMEFWQFHPTGVANKGMLLSEAARGEGGVLRNGLGEAFMVKYAPHVKDLASRDVVARAIAIEVKEGRGCGPDKDHVLLDLTHLDTEMIKQRLPGIRDLALTFAGLDMCTDAIPVYPTAHYMMGGIPTNFKGQVLTLDDKGESIPVSGLYAVGECACVSVHGANRLGGNSLLDIVVFGRAAAQEIDRVLQTQKPSDFFDQPLDLSLIAARLQKWENQSATEVKDPTGVIKSDLQTAMQEGCGVFRNVDSMQTLLAELDPIQQRIDQAVLSDHSRAFNLDRIEALELENLMTLAYATVHSAVLREESRGAHSRIDFTERDDVNWLKHSLYFIENHQVRYKPVTLTALTVEGFKPKPRVY
ncbi:MAG: succinate dehydrogenase flavoprotein subunit [Piscirickettsiaceae bacterium CG_4_9_14_3_um_filter_43_564]|nr:succinate dehydrogenase flavoprotein subunit [Thiomicrospira sp.]OIP97057.1 MAG: succinate dehydrogenase flavoprotein subunit [Thiomicrospira sp. CG2_30_44_34]PIQ05133.1 MAG: succinate dehydrogenase flavoprotein subunit [Piscirickettsiaceae bacterium CG18_big_fil_WC_8_21_14_2_50_44_103]PIU37754.1 MAG: succinate dehydrogenase flavoprotein subunit [Piscirickettsiaceae bacterium CG07_land_8_20_14_0_80_44_28]PIW58495.1 MAG: succinate dehydrogenase flavoprotein subunit [Piscirickettsiaceae bacter